MEARSITGAASSHLIERESELALLADRRDSVVKSGDGQLVLIGGEAGLGKTSLVRSVVESTRMRCLSGACDSLFTPRPLGPLLDIAATTGGELEELVEAGATPHQVATTLLRELRDKRPALLVLEDLHWADEATLDVFGILAGRVRSVPALVLATYRDDELDRAHPLRLVLGGLATREGITRIALSPLSEEAVAGLAAQSGVDPHALHRTTGGNPFYVTEVLATDVAQIPPTVRDAVHARVARLGSQARELLDAAAVLPPPVELGLLEAVAQAAIDGLNECVGAGLLTDRAGRLAFRHELARLAIEEALPATTRAALHRAALTWETNRAKPDPARLAHHADAAGDAAAVLEFAPAAAQRASSVGAHREAEAQYERALRFADALSPAERGDLLDARAYESRAIGEFRRAIALSREAATEHERSGDTAKQASSLCALALPTWYIGGTSDARAVVDEALRALKTDPDSPVLLNAYGMLAALALSQLDRDSVLAWCRRGSELAQRLGLPAPLFGEIYSAGVDFARGSEVARPLLETAVDRAVAAGDDDAAGLGFGLLILGAIRSRRFALADSYIRNGLDYCAERDLTGHEPYFLAWQAALAAERGQWAEAEAGAQRLLTRGGIGPATALTLVTVARLRVRLGQPGQREAIDAALERAERSGGLWLIASATSTIAEAAWLEGRPGDVAELTDRTWDALVRTGDTWVAGELAAWRRRCGIADALPDWLAEPYARELSGDALGAAALWDELGCPYDAALARAGAGDESALRLALDQLREFGAEPAAAVVARRLRERGAKGLPRGPRPATRDNPAGLTSREVEVLTLVAEGLRNGDIAQRLFLSEKTVAHHVSAILRKLDVRTRGEAGAAAVRLGLTAG